MQNTVIDPYQELYNAIVLQAVTDYRNALAGDSYCGTPPEDVVGECERFFRSEYFALLTKVPGEYLIERIRKEVEDESRSNSTNT